MEITYETRRICDKFYIDWENLEKTEDGFTYHGNLGFSEHYLTGTTPMFLKNIGITEVNGNISFTACGLTSLKGCPKCKELDVSFNRLETFNHVPECNKIIINYAGPVTESECIFPSEIEIVNRTEKENIKDAIDWITVMNQVSMQRGEKNYD